LEWLKATKWDGKLPLVTGGVGQESMPFIQIPTAGGNEEEQPSSTGNTTTTTTNPASSGL
jgi:prohibitin 2